MKVLFLLFIFSLGFAKPLSLPDYICQLKAQLADGKKLIPKEKNASQIRLATELFFPMSEQQKLEFFIDKIPASDIDPLRKIEPYINKVAIQIHHKEKVDSNKFQTTLQNYSKDFLNLKVDNSIYTSAVKSVLVIFAGQPLRKKAFDEAFAEFKKYRSKNEFELLTLEKLINQNVET